MDSREDERAVRFDAVGARASFRYVSVGFVQKGERGNSEKE